MRLIDEIEISYFRSFYKFKLKNLADLNIIFGKNDVGKSNVVRALSLFFSGYPDHTQIFDFPTDFCEHRLRESEQSEDIRKFIYVKITFNTPKSFQKSLGNQFYIKRQWTVSRDDEYHEETNIPKNRRHIATRFINKIKFIYIPAIKDIRIFEMLLSEIHETLADSAEFKDAINNFSSRVQESTKDMFKNLPKEVSDNTKIGAPTRMSQLFQTLDFETIAIGESNPKSLTRQRGDGVKVRHIPELLDFISENDSYDYHIWGFEEPENSLDFSASQSESIRFLDLAKKNAVQVFMTTHSPSFYLLNDASAARFYIRKDENGLSTPLQGKDLSKFSIEEALEEGFYLPAVADAIKKVADTENRTKILEQTAHQLQEELGRITKPLVLTEGRTDARLILLAWEKRRGVEPPFIVRSCETGGEAAGAGNGGAISLAIRLKGIAADNPCPVIGLFDYDSEGISAYKLDRNFVEETIDGFTIKRGMHGKSYATLLPAPTFRSECLFYKNLPIEFMFRDECIDKKINGKGLNLEIMSASRKIGDTKIEIPLDDRTHFKDIRSGKSDFAEYVAPTFDADAFDGFDKLFSIIEALISHAGAP